MHVEDDYYCKLFDCKLALLLKQELLVIVFTGMSTISILCVAFSYFCSLYRFGIAFHAIKYMIL